MRRIKLYLSIQITLFLLIGCSAKSSIVDSQFSQPPSWNNIIPGKTTNIEALSRLKKIDSIDQSTIYVDAQGYGNWKDSITWKFTKDSSDSYGRIFMRNDLVSIIMIEPRNNRADLNNVVKLYGNPEKVFAGGAQGQRIITYFLYPSKGIVISHLEGYPRTNEGVSVKPNDDVFEAYYFSTDEFQSAFLDSYYFPASISDYENNAQDWQGYDKPYPVLIKFK